MGFKNDDLNYEIQLWIEEDPKTLRRLRKFYDSIISIHLGGKGLKRLLNEAIESGKDYIEVKRMDREYKINYPKEEDK